jgi:hypothetical protein
MKNFKLKSIGSNMATISTVDGTVILFSYETPVAALLPSGRHVKTSKKWSPTTTKHINKWLVGVSSPVEELDQNFFDSLIRGDY